MTVRTGGLTPARPGGALPRTAKQDRAQHGRVLARESRHAWFGTEYSDRATTAAGCRGTRAQRRIDRLVAFAVIVGESISRLALQASEQRICRSVVRVGRVTPGVFAHVKPRIDAFGSRVPRGMGVVIQLNNFLLLRNVVYPLGM